MDFCNQGQNLIVETGTTTTTTPPPAAPAPPPTTTTTTTRERFYRIFTYNEKRQERHIQRHAFVDFRLFYIRHEVARLVRFVESQWQEVQHHHFQVRLTYRNTYVATRSLGVFDLIYLLIKQQRQKDIQNV